MTENNITYQNSSIFYSTIGKGKTVVLIHGFAEDNTIWEKQVLFLKDHFKLILPNIPGTGKSAFLNNATIETYADIIKQIVDVEAKKTDGENGAEICIIGHSMGGYVTLAFAEKHPQYLSGFGLFHSSAFADNEEKIQTRLKSISFIKENGSHAFLKTMIPNLFTSAFTKNNSDLVNELIEKGRAYSIETLVQYYEAMIERPDRTAVLKEFLKPVLFIIGEFDTAIPLQTSLQQCYLPQNSHVHILNKSAHMGMREETYKVNEILIEFLKSIV